MPFLPNFKIIRQDSYQGWQNLSNLAGKISIRSPGAGEVGLFTEVLGRIISLEIIFKGPLLFPKGTEEK